MRTIVASISRWDHVWLTAIFGLHGRRLVTVAMPKISRTADGLCYPLLALALPNFYPIAGAWALAVGFARIYLGVHYPTDVVAGMLLGGFSALAGIAAAN